MWQLFVMYECVKMFRRKHCLQLPIRRPQDVRFPYFYMEVTPSPDTFYQLNYTASCTVRQQSLQAPTCQPQISNHIFRLYDSLSITWSDFKWSLCKSLNQTPFVPSKAIRHVKFLYGERQLLIWAACEICLAVLPLYDCLAGQGDRSRLLVKETCLSLRARAVLHLPPACIHPQENSNENV